MKLIRLSLQRQHCSDLLACLQVCSMNVAAFRTSSLVSSVSRVMIRGRPPLCTNWVWCASAQRGKKMTYFLWRREGGKSARRQSAQNWKDKHQRRKVGLSPHDVPDLPDASVQWLSVSKIESLSSGSRCGLISTEKRCETRPYWARPEAREAKNRTWRC